MVAVHVHHLQLTFNIKISRELICATAAESGLGNYIHLKYDLPRNTEKVHVSTLPIKKSHQTKHKPQTNKTQS